MCINCWLEAAWAIGWKLALFMGLGLPLVLFICLMKSASMDSRDEERGRR